MTIIIVYNLSPNPTNDFVTLELTNEIYFIKIFDQTGKCVLEQTSNTGKVQINLTTLTAGLYFIQASGNKKTLTGKVIKH